MSTKINTDRLTLEKVTVEDHAFILDLVTSEGWLEFIGSRNVHSNEDAIAYIEKINDTPDLTYWVVRIKAVNTPVGIISFLKRTYLEHFDIGFAFLPAYQGNGYAYEAAKEVLTTVGENPDHAIILATTIPGNERSVQLLTKLGFRFYKEMDVDSKKLHVYATGGETI